MTIKKVTENKGGNKQTSTKTPTKPPRTGRDSSTGKFPGRGENAQKGINESIKETNTTGPKRK